MNETWGKERSMDRPLEGIKVIDAATMIAGAMIGTVMADFGADVIKVEHPNGDPLRLVGEQKDGVSIHWKVYNRGKRCMTLHLGKTEGAAIFKQLAAQADVVIENYRPGTMERWGLGWDVLHALNPRLVMVRVSGFGQTGPYATRSAFGTTCEAMSGFASLNGSADGPPTFPPVGLADNICGMVGAWATAFALYHRDARGGSGQMIDLAILEALMSVQGPGVTVFDQLGKVQTRTGNHSATSAPRNAYVTADGRWVAISASSTKLAEAAMHLVGRADLIQKPWFGRGRDRACNSDTIDAAVQNWLGRLRYAEASDLLASAGIPFAPIHDIAGVASDPHVVERGVIATLSDPDLGAVKMQNVPVRFSSTQGAVSWAGRSLSADTEAILAAECGLAAEEIARLKDEGVTA